MRIESVTARGFGPLAGQTLELAPGLTVITGDNESGKSSWHAATVAALCGRRRGRGRPSVEEQRFIDAHQPWDGGPWMVSCLLRLDDGRQIELRQDLSGKVDCRATDVLLARDVSAEIMVDGSPDASAWLGLTRSSFQATACVGQAEVMRVLDAADGLQHALQQAASTAGTSGTAAGAIVLLEACRRTEVGRDTSAAVRPLRKGREAVARAEQDLLAAEGAREEWEASARAAAGLEAEVAATLVAAEAAARDVAQHGELVRAAERRAAREEVGSQPFVPGPPSPRVAARQRSYGKFGLVAFGALAAALVVVALVMNSAVPAVVAGLLVVVAVGAGRLLTGRGSAAPGEVTGRSDDAPRACAGSAELGELRLEWAERQALAESARRRHHETALRAGRVDAVRGERASTLLSRGEAEESLASARRELGRVQELDQTLGLAIDFLGRAQERVHRAVAPELTDVLREWLPRLTDGRYVDVRMDPASLAVEVCGPDREFRSAQLLSHGTAEQVYLLLRVALAAQLTAGHDTCPLLLDDITVHADATRCQRLLELLHELSQSRQIVLFAHHELVREWAHQELDDVRDRLVCLDRVRVS